MKKDCPQPKVGRELEQRNISHTVSQPPHEIGSGEGSSAGKLKAQIGKPAQQGRVFALTQQEAEESPDVSGM